MAQINPMSARCPVCGKDLALTVVATSAGRDGSSLVVLVTLSEESAALLRSHAVDGVSVAAGV